MKLLITTQAVDTSDSNLGFFVRWIIQFAEVCESVTVICLREGTHELPKNVTVIPLVSQSELPRAVELLRIAYAKRKTYDAVFVHMNPEYLVVAGWLWKILDKRLALWYTHKSVNLKLRIAVFFADLVFTASRGSFPLSTSKLKVMGHGIDTDFFSADPAAGRSTILSVGRLMKSKHHDLAVRAAALTHEELTVIGEGPERAGLEELANECGATVHFLGGLPQEKLRDEYRKAKFLIHSSDTGGLDKVVLEALATDVAVITTTPDMFRELPLESVHPTPEAVAGAITHTRESWDRAAIIREKHSLNRLIPTLVQNLETA
jgi:glycosyltransferase involved in cell wall biosynthesis